MEHMHSLVHSAVLFMIAAEAGAKKAIVHLYRNESVCSKSDRGMGHTDNQLAHGHKHDVTADNYHRGCTNPNAMLISSGWTDRFSFNCFRATAGAEMPIPEELLNAGGFRLRCYAIQMHWHKFLEIILLWHEG